MRALVPKFHVEQHGLSGVPIGQDIVALADYPDPRPANNPTNNPTNTPTNTPANNPTNTPANNPSNTPSADAAPTETNVIVAVAAAGLNRADLLQAAGHYPPPPGASPVLGLECAGEVIAAPADSALKSGEQVCALVTGGALADRVRVPAEHVLPVPGGLSLPEAAVVVEAAATTWSNLVNTGGLCRYLPEAHPVLSQPLFADLPTTATRQTVLIHGGSGGIGSFACQVARLFGAKVLTTAGSDQRCQKCLPLGAHLAFNYHHQVFKNLKEATAPRGCDLILDVTGAQNLNDNIGLLARNGRLVIIGLQRGRHGDIDLGGLLARQASIHGTTLRARPAAERTQLLAEVHRYLWPLLAEGVLQPVLDRVFGFAEAEAAFAALAVGRAFGKVVIDFR